MSTTGARKTIYRQVVVQVMKEEGRPTYLVEWPPYCLLTLKQIREGQPYLESISDMVACTSCDHYLKRCVPDKPRLYHREVELED